MGEPAPRVEGRGHHAPRVEVRIPPRVVDIGLVWDTQFVTALANAASVFVGETSDGWWQTTEEGYHELYVSPALCLRTAVRGGAPPAARTIVIEAASGLLLDVAQHVIETGRVGDANHNRVSDHLPATFMRNRGQAEAKKVQFLLRLHQMEIERCDRAASERDRARSALAEVEEELRDAKKQLHKQRSRSRT